MNAHPYLYGALYNIYPLPCLTNQEGAFSLVIKILHRDCFKFMLSQKYPLRILILWTKEDKTITQHASL